MASFSCTPALASAVAALAGSDAAHICAKYDVARMGASEAVLAWTVSELRAAQDSIAQVNNGLDTAYILASAYQVFIMQLGFALFAAGVVRPKNVVAIFLKNFYDTCIAGIGFYLIGYGFAVGAKDPTNKFIGNWDFALSSTDSAPVPRPWHLFVWYWSFCSAATTILSGSIAERGTFISYAIYAVAMPIWVWPVVVHWLWSPYGWLSAKNRDDAILGIGAIDFAGSGVVHLVGGVASLVGSVFVGPRVGRFGGSPALDPKIYRSTASPQLYLMGTFLLWFGWYGFNSGSRLGIASYAEATVVGRTAVTTTLSPCAGAITGLFLSYHRHRTWDLLSACVSALSGLVSVTAGCSVMQPWAAIICGSVGALVFEFGERLLERLQIDDPVSAFPLHGMCGLWGLIFAGLLAHEDYIYEVYGVPKGGNRMGLFYGGHAQLLLCQFIACLAIAGWTAANMSLLFGALKRFNLLRVTREKEAAGMDLAACGQFNAPGAVNPNSAKVGGSKGDISGRSWVAHRLNEQPSGFDASSKPRSANASAAASQDGAAPPPRGGGLGDGSMAGGSPSAGASSSPGEAGGSGGVAASLYGSGLPPSPFASLAAGESVDVSPPEQDRKGHHQPIVSILQGGQ